MRQEDKLKEKVGTKIPYSVPEGYFKSFKANLMEQLPEYPEKPREVKLSVWQRIRPYVYLAAMFAGIWCMMQIFHHVSQQTVSRQDQILAAYEPDSYDYYLEESSVDAQYELEDEVLSLYPSLDEFKRDFYAQL